MRSPAQLDLDCKLIDAELDRHFAAPDSEISPAALDHLDVCERCRELYRWISEAEPPEEPAERVYTGILKSLEASLKPVSPLPSTRGLVVQFLTAFVLFSLPIGAILGLAGFRLMALPQLIGVTVILAAGACALSFSLAWQMRPGSLQRFSPWIAVAVLGIGFTACVGILFPWQSPEAFLAQGWPCSLVGSTTAALAGLVFWFLARRGAPLRLGTLGGALGAIAGLLAVTVLQFSCRRQEAGHLLVWHGGVLLVSTLVGVLIARAFERFGSWSASPFDRRNKHSNA
jgi:negative regulator of sigma F NrsF-like protein